jgi:hypothetical protein
MHLTNDKLNAFESKTFMNLLPYVAIFVGQKAEGSKSSRNYNEEGKHVQQQLH